MKQDIVLNKHLYKVNLVLLKLLPVIMCSGLIIASYGATFQVITGFGIILQIVSHYLGLVIAPIGFMYISSYIFKFCNYHRMFIHYIAIIELMNVTNWYFKIPITNDLYNGIQIIITILFLFLAIVMYIKKRKNIKLYKKETRIY
jgi:hypothetical protein